MNKFIKTNKQVDCLGANCPIPLVKTREAVMKGKKGDVIEVIGNHEQSFDEIPMALNSLGINIIKKYSKGDKWHIIFKI